VNHDGDYDVNYEMLREREIRVFKEIGIADVHEVNGNLGGDSKQRDFTWFGR